METQVITIDPEDVGRVRSASDSSASSSLARVVDRANAILDLGGLVAIPTETVYGLAVRADKPDGVARLRSIKSRGADRPFTVHIGRPEDAARFAPRPGGLVARLIRKAWPGPLTLIVPVENPTAAPVMADLNGAVATAMYHEGTIGLRCPEHPLTEHLLQNATGPVVATSANLAGQPAPLTGKDVLANLDGQIDLLLDCGRTKYAKPSTIVAVTGSAYKILREGVLDAGIIQRLSPLGILLVCTGNTCRSPMAAGMAKKMLAERLGCSAAQLPERGIIVESAGTSGGGGGASAHAAAVLARRGIDLSDHVSKRLTAQMVRQADFIFVMTRSHRDRVVEMVPSAEDRVSMLLADSDLRDPVGGTEDEYEQCAEAIEQALAIRLQEVTV